MIGAWPKEVRRTFGVLVFVVLSVLTLPMPEASGASQADVTAELLRRVAFTRCSMKADRGPCKALFERYYYDEKSKACKRFFWGGCDGSVPFETAEECEQACLSPETLRISELKALAGDLYAEVSLEFPKAWTRPVFTVLVDGRELLAKPRSGGFSADRQMESLIFFPGRPGRKQVTITTDVEGQRFEATGWLEWSAAPLIALIDHTGDRELVLEKQKLTLVTVNVDDPTIGFNGTEVRPEPFGQHAKVMRFEPSWVNGKNVLTVRGTGPDGTLVSRSFSFVYPADKALVEGETVVLPYGAPGSRSGPFFRTAVEGPALATSPGTEAMLYVLSEDGWLGQEVRLVQELKAAKPGSATVRIFEKPHFRQPEQLRKEIVLRVGPRP